MAKFALNRNFRLTSRVWIPDQPLTSNDPFVGLNSAFAVALFVQRIHNQQTGQREKKRFHFLCFRFEFTQNPERKYFKRELSGVVHQLKRRFEVGASGLNDRVYGCGATVKAMANFSLPTEIY